MGHELNFHFKSLMDLLERFPTEDVAREHFENIRWNGKPVCAHCASENVYGRKGRVSYKCRDCKKEFTVRSGTIFGDSKIGFRKWFAAIYLLMVHKKGISSCQLATDLGVTQKTAWFMLHRIRFVFKSQSFEMPAKGVVQVDETYVGGKEMNKHQSKKLRAGRGMVGKTPVIGIYAKGVGVLAFKVPNVRGNTLMPIIAENVRAGSILVTDEHAGYRNAHKHYDHRVVRHGRNQYAANLDSTNGIENFWSHFKRLVYGIYHYISPKHLDAYLAAQSFRYNQSDIEPWEVFTLTAFKTEGKRLTYSELISENEQGKTI